MDMGEQRRSGATEGGCLRSDGVSPVDAGFDWALTG